MYLIILIYSFQFIGHFRFVTIASDSANLYRALVLARGLQRVNSQFRLDIFLHPETQNKLLLSKIYFSIKNSTSKQNYHVNVFPNEIDKRLIDPPPFVIKRWRYAWAKVAFVAMYKLYNRIVVLDNDLVILENIDLLFKLEFKLAMTPDYQCKETLMSNHYNSGVIVINPSKYLSIQMLKNIDRGCIPKMSHCEGDQDFFELLFKQVGGLALSSQYNMPSNICQVNDIKIYHMFHHKPWRQAHIVAKKKCTQILIDKWENDSYWVYKKIKNIL